MKGERCVVCGREPVLYFSNGHVFCRRHKADASVRARRGLQTWQSSEYAKQYSNIGGTLYTPSESHTKGKGYRHKLRRGL